MTLCFPRDLLCKFTFTFSSWEHWCSEPHHSPLGLKSLQRGEINETKSQILEIYYLCWIKISLVQLTINAGSKCLMKKKDRKRLKDCSVKPRAEVGRRYRGITILQIYWCPCLLQKSSQIGAWLQYRRYSFLNPSSIKVALLHTKMNHQ